MTEECRILRLLVFMNVNRTETQERRNVMYEFTEDCKVGIEEIDAEHEKLFELLNQATEMKKTGGNAYIVAKSLLEELKDYAVFHFAHEEKYMEKIHDRELESQRREHELFKEKVNSYQVEGLSEEEGEKVIEEILAFTAKWLYRHILGSDTMIGKFPEKTPENISAKTTNNEFAFSDEYRTGIDFVDDEHERLFEIIEEAHNVIQAELLHDKYDAIVDIMEKLMEYTMVHFSHEEEYMEQIGYEGLNIQRIAHSTFVDRLSDIDLKEMDDNQEEYLVDLVQFLLGWLTNHILKLDMKIPK